MNGNSGPSLKSLAAMKAKNAGPPNEYVYALQWRSQDIADARAQ